MKPLNLSFAADVASSFAGQPIMNLIDAGLGLVEPGKVEIELPFRADLTQQDGYLHAGVITTIADSACGYAAFSLMPNGSRVLSVEFKVNLLRPARGETFVARAEVIKGGTNLECRARRCLCHRREFRKNTGSNHARDNDVFGMNPCLFSR